MSNANVDGTASGDAHGSCAPALRLRPFVLRLPVLPKLSLGAEHTIHMWAAVTGGARAHESESTNSAPRESGHIVVRFRVEQDGRAGRDAWGKSEANVDKTVAPQGLLLTTSRPDRSKCSRIPPIVHQTWSTKELQDVHLESVLSWQLLNQAEEDAPVGRGKGQRSVAGARDRGRCRRQGQGPTVSGGCQGQG